MLLTGADGDARRPDNFRGDFQVALNGLPFTVGVISTGGTFYVRLPYAAGYHRDQPSRYGFGDPAQLLDPAHGLSSLMTVATNLSLAPRDRLNGAELDEVHGTLPGQIVADLLTSADPHQNVDASFGLDVSTHELRRLQMTGPFFDAHRTSSYVVVLDKYGESVSITPPA